LKLKNIRKKSVYTSGITVKENEMYMTIKMVTKIRRIFADPNIR
jgi:hypothetical protein